MISQVLSLMMEADLDHNGTIEFPEFLQLMKEKYGRDDQEADLRLIMMMMMMVMMMTMMVFIPSKMTRCTTR